LALDDDDADADGDDKGNRSSACYLRDGANALTPVVANRPRRKALENFMVVAVDERKGVAGEGGRFV
jgi:hypothetical protein